MDLAVGTGVLHVAEGDAVNPVTFTALPLPHVVLDVGPDDISTMYIEKEDVRYLVIFQSCIEIWNKCHKLINAMKTNPDAKTKVLEVVCKDYSKINEDAYLCYVFETTTKC